MSPCHLTTVLALSAALLLCACSTDQGGDATDAAAMGDSRDTPAPDRPNILIILADDLGYNDLAINNGNTQIDTPNLDQLARNGVRFTRHYAAAVCSPARAALLTGNYPERLGYLPDARGISPEIVTLPERLKEEGYATWHIGKWHIGSEDRGAWPDRQGFDHWFGFLHQWRLAGEHKDGRFILANPRYENPWLDSDSEPGRHYPGHLETILTAKAVDVISRLQEAGSPWFVNLWYYAPHTPIRPAPEFAANYPDTGAGRYRALVNQLDHNVGVLMRHLENIGALENTIVIAVSDNGGTNAELDNNTPFVGRKAEVTEGGLRTPLIVRWPDKSLNGQVYPDTVSIADIYPTLLAAIGAAAPEHLDGRSFYHSIQQGGTGTPRRLFWEIGNTSYSVLSADGDWRLHRPFAYLGVPQQSRLFDLARDPAAALPLVSGPAAPLAQLTKEYQSWYRDVHTVDTVYTPGLRGGGVLTGMSFLRTPGFGAYTFGIGIADDAAGLIAAQRGVWELRRSGNTVSARFGDTQLSGELRQSDGCHSIVISGVFRRRVSYFGPPDAMELTLYLDGLEAQSTESNKSLAVDDPTIQTVIGHIDPGSTVGTAGRPVIVNMRLDTDTPWTIDAFSQALCRGHPDTSIAQVLR